MAHATTAAVLITVDGPSHSRRALAFLVKRASADKRLRLCVLNVQLPFLPSLFVTRAMIDQYRDTKSKEDLKVVPGILAKHASAETLVRIGDPAQTTVQVAKQKHCAEIV